MAKITINPIVSGNNLETAINLRLQQIEDAFNDNVLWRYGIGANPNSMAVDLDLNGNDILNAGDVQIEGYGGLTSSIATLDAAVNNRVQISGDTMTGPLTLSGAPVNALHAATRQFVIDTVGAGGAILTTKGDLVTYDTATTRLPVGTNGQVLSADSAEATGLKWVEATSGITNTAYVSFADTPVTPVADTLYNVDTSGGDVTFTLPTCSGNDKFRFAVKKTTSDANSVILDPDGTDEIDGVASTYSLTLEDSGANVLCDEGATPDGWNTMAWGSSSTYIGSPGDGEATVVYMGRDLSAGTSYVTSFVTSSQTVNPTTLDFNEDGTKMYVANATTIYQYSLSTPYLVSTAVYDSVSKTTTVSGINGLNFKSDGTKVFISDSVTKNLYIKPLTVAWDITTITSTGQTTFSAGTYTTEQNGAYMNPDGTLAYWCNGNDPDTMEQVILTKNWDFDSDTTVYGGSLTVFAENPSVEGCAFSPDGTKMWNIDDSTGLYQYTCSVPYDIRTAVYDSYVYTGFLTQDTSVWGIRFSPDGQYMYLTGWDTDSVLQYQLTMDAIPAPATQSVSGTVVFADYDEAYENQLHYKAVSPATVKYAMLDADALNCNLTNTPMYTSDQYNTYVGVGVATNITTSASYKVTAVGNGAFEGHISGKAGNTGPLTCVGVQSAAHSKGADNCFMGWRSGFGVNGGWSGDKNVGVGDETLGSVSGSPSRNVGTGYQALKSSTGNDNFAGGCYALSGLGASSNRNTGVGASAGIKNTFGDDNIYIGYAAGPTSTGSQSDQLYIDVSQRNDALIRGDFSARTITINGSLSVAGGMSGGYVDDTTGVALDFTAGLMHAIQPVAASNPTYTFTAPSAGATCTIIATNLGAAGTITWPTAVKWEGGTEPTWTSSGIDRIKLDYDGTNYYATATLAHA